MVEAVSNIKSGVMFAAKSDSVKTETVKNDYERTPAKDTVELKEDKKSFKGWIIGTIVAAAAFGLYFLTKGKKGTNAAKKAVDKAAADVNVKKPASDSATVPTKVKSETVQKEEPAVEVLKPDKIIIPKKTKTKKKGKAEKLKSSPSVQDVVDIEPVLSDKQAGRLKDSDKMTATVRDL